MIPETFVPVLAETKVFNRNGLLCRILIMLMNGVLKSGLVIFDYKTNRFIYKNFKNFTAKTFSFMAI